jgi:hypothetical protein
MLAFIATDVAHETIGHGAAFIALGGRSMVLTTTRLIHTHILGEAGGRIFSIGGPLGNLACAAVAWLAQRALRGAHVRARVFLWLTMAFNLFWGTGYLIYSGVLHLGDWYELVRWLQPEWLWRVILIVFGVILYRFSIRLCVVETRWFMGSPATGRADQEWLDRLRRLIHISYFAAGILACVGAVFDPRGVSQVFYSGAASSFLSNAGLLMIPGLSTRLLYQTAPPSVGIVRSFAWMLVAALAAGVFIAILGPGLLVSL